MTDPRYMTYDQARARLRRLFRVRELVRELEEFGYSSSHDTSSGYIAHHAPAPGSSPHEAEIVRRLDLEASVAKEAAALAKLHPEQQRFAELRWGQRPSLPFRSIARDLHRSVGGTYLLERRTLAAFIAAMGYHLPGASANGRPRKSSAETGS